MSQSKSSRRRCNVWMSRLGAVAIAYAVSVSHAQDIVPAPIQTPWDSQVDPDNVLPEYPRPQLVRRDWRNLNGKWDYAVTKKDAAPPAQWTGKILVPFCFEADLSGVNRLIQDDEWMWYHRTLVVPPDWTGQRIWLNFQACDWETVVYINRQEVGRHRGGYTPFSLDITDIKRPVYSLTGQTPHYARYIETLRLEQAYNLSGAVYTQLTDMRHEQNGWLTFDRKVSKIPVAELRSIHTTLYRPLPTREPLLRAASRWTDAGGKTVSFPTRVTGPVGQAESTRKKNRRKAAVQLPAVRPQPYVTRFGVSSAPDKAALNVFLDAQHGRDTFGYLLVYLDDHLIYDDMSRHKKAEHRVTCVPLTDEQTALLTPGTHELKIEVTPSVAIESLDLSLDAILGQ